MLILSTPTAAGATARAATRQAWAHNLPTRPCVARFWFVLGSTGHMSNSEVLSSGQLERESDLLFVDAPEGYRNVTRKVLAAFDWLVHRQPMHFEYVFKTDDDAFICVGGLLRVLRRQRPLYAGLAVPPQRVIVLPGHRWQDLAYAKVFRRRMYLDYFQGLGYALRMELVRTVIANADRLGLWTSDPPPANEDAWVGALARTQHNGAGASVGSVLPINRSLAVEALLPAAQWISRENTTRACAAGYLMVHKLAPRELLTCAEAAAAAPPYCHLRTNGRVPRGGEWWMHPPRSAGGSERCSCDAAATR